MSERFILQKSTDPEYWVCTDTENMIVCKFKEHNFNEDQNFTTLENFSPENFMQLAQYVREMSDWLFKMHYRLIF